MIPVERQLGEVAEVMTGMAGFGTGGEYRYKVVQPNNFSDTGIMGMVEQQKRNDEISEKQRLMIGDILVKRLNPSFVHVVALESVGMVASQNLLGQIEHVTGSAAAIKAISVKKLAAIAIPIVPIAEQRKVGEIWKLSRKRKELLNEYIAENDRLVSMLASKIISGGGTEK